MTDWQLGVLPPLTTRRATFFTPSLPEIRLPHFASFSSFFLATSRPLRRVLRRVYSFFFSSLRLLPPFFFVRRPTHPPDRPAKPIIRHRLIRSVSEQSRRIPRGSFFRRREETVRCNLVDQSVSGSSMVDTSEISQKMESFVYTARSIIRC